MLQNVLSFFLLITTSVYASNSFPYIKPVSVEINPKPQIIINEVVVKKETPNKVVQKPANENLDSDLDGILDVQDKCPDTSTGFIIDNYGCPQIPVVNIDFNLHGDTLTDEILLELENMADFLKENQNFQVVIYGYANAQDNDEDNKVLSRKRATIVKKALISHGISSTKLTAIGKGSTDTTNIVNPYIEIELIN